MLLIFGCLSELAAQRPKLRYLKNPNFQAGCFISQGNNAYANLYWDQDGQNGALFNITGKDEFFKNAKVPPKYSYAYQNEQYRIYVKQMSTKKIPDSCIEEIDFEIKVIFRGKSYIYRLPGFCGC
jgi:hypothetical protein